MILYKVIGYDEETGNYTNPDTGHVENLPYPAFAIGVATPANYAIFDAPEDWAFYSTSLYGICSIFNDYITLAQQVQARIELIAGSDYSNWSLLSLAQKSIALLYCPLQIITAKGTAFYVTQCGSQVQAKQNILSFFNSSISAREMRYEQFSFFAFKYMGRSQAIKAELYAVKDALVYFFKERGVVYNSEDGIDGLGDWTLGLSSYIITGLKPRIVAGEFTLSGITTDDFCNGLVSIIHDGVY